MSAPTPSYAPLATLKYLARVDSVRCVGKRGDSEPPAHRNPRLVEPFAGNRVKLNSWFQGEVLRPQRRRENTWDYKLDQYCPVKHFLVLCNLIRSNALRENIAVFDFKSAVYLSHSFMPALPAIWKGVANAYRADDFLSTDGFSTEAGIR